MDYKNLIKEILVNNQIADIAEKVEKIELFQQLLLEYNKEINLISRRCDVRDVWLNHIYDSLLPIGHIKLDGKTVLDFGSGGGLPGIPLKIIFPGSYMYLLDSRKKKIGAVKNIIKKLDLTDCLTICSRLEDMDKTWMGYFDVIISRSVRIEYRYWQKLKEVSNEEAHFYFYKARKYDDLQAVKGIEKYDISHELVGVRTLIEMKKKDVPRGT
jgi:16S rRNA (guanine527-N7)-methyltransferase